MKTGGGGVVLPCRQGDIPRLTAIYRHYVVDSLSSFEIEPPDESQMFERWQEIIAVGLPFLVAKCGGEVAGFAYAVPYRARAAYRFTVEDSVYVDQAFGRRGLGRKLLVAVINACEEKNYRQMIAVIADEDADASLALHRALGFVEAGRLEAVGCKQGRWLDTIRMQKRLGSGHETAPTD